MFKFALLLSLYAVVGFAVVVAMSYGPTIYGLISLLIGVLVLGAASIVRWSR